MDGRFRAVTFPVTDSEGLTRRRQEVKEPMGTAVTGHGWAPSNGDRRTRRVGLSTTGERGGAGFFSVSSAPSAASDTQTRLGVEVWPTATVP
jgi:hypothetical protein